MPLTIRNLGLTHDETAIVRVALAVLEARPDVLSKEGRVLLTGLQPDGTKLEPLADRIDAVLDRFAGAPGIVTQDEADHRDQMVAQLKGEASR